MERATIGIARGLLAALLILASVSANAGVEPAPEAALDLEATLEPGSESVPPRITFRVFFEGELRTTGYDLSAAWNPQVLRADSAPPSNLLADSAASSVTLEPLRTRIAAIRVDPIETGDLFEMSFEVLTAGTGPSDFRVFVDPTANGVGIGIPEDAPGLAIANPDGVDARIVGTFPDSLRVVLRVPEPSRTAGGLASLGLFAWWATRRRPRKAG